MSEVLRRVDLALDLPQRLADQVEAVSEAERRALDRVLATALALWSDERSEAEEVRQAVAEADANPEADVDAADYFRDLRARLTSGSDRGPSRTAVWGLSSRGAPASTSTKSPPT